MDAAAKEREGSELGDAHTRRTLWRIVRNLTSDPVLREDLMQECLVRVWQLSREKPGQTRSWYLHNCRYHLQHCLDEGRSVDSFKRANGRKRVPIDGTIDEEPPLSSHTERAGLRRFLMIPSWR